MKSCPNHICAVAKVQVVATKQTKLAQEQTVM
nr:MAG TPA: hypothetical protein [Caudoviricetes sp.]